MSQVFTLPQPRREVQAAIVATWSRGEFEGGLPHLISIDCDVGSSTTPAGEYLRRIRREIRACEKRAVKQGVDEPRGPLTPSPPPPRSQYLSTGRGAPR